MFKSDKMKKIIMSAAMMVALAACGGSNAPTASAPGLNPKSKISILFQDFPAGTECSVTLPSGRLQTPAVPGKIDYPAANAKAPVRCKSPDGATYAVDVRSVLPAGEFRVAGLTAYGTGLIVSTVSAGDLLRFQNENGVTRRK
jgi:hypothetical protein